MRESIAITRRKLLPSQLIDFSLLPGTLRVFKCWPNGVKNWMRFDSLSLAAWMPPTARMEPSWFHCAHTMSIWQSTTMGSIFWWWFLNLVLSLQSWSLFIFLTVVVFAFHYLTSSVRVGNTKTRAVGWDWSIWSIVPVYGSQGNSQWFQAEYFELFLDDGHVFYNFIEIIFLYF